MSWISFHFLWPPPRLGEIFYPLKALNLGFFPICAMEQCFDFSYMQGKTVQSVSRKRAIKGAQGRIKKARLVGSTLLENALLAFHLVDVH
jgi:hypothetical protein